MTDTTTEHDIELGQLGGVQVEDQPAGVEAVEGYSPLAKSSEDELLLDAHPGAE